MSRRSDWKDERGPQWGSTGVVITCFCWGERKTKKNHFIEELSCSREGGSAKLLRSGPPVPANESTIFAVNVWRKLVACQYFRGFWIKKNYDRCFLHTALETRLTALMRIMHEMIVLFSHYCRTWSVRSPMLQSTTLDIAHFRCISVEFRRWK